MSSLSPLPFQFAGFAETRVGEFNLFYQTLERASNAYALRERMYARDVADLLIRLGLDLGKSVTVAARKLATEQPYWACVCARPYLEYSLRLLWAMRSSDGMEKLYAYHCRNLGQWWGKLEKNKNQPDPLLASIRSLPPLPQQPDVPSDMRQIINEIGNADTADGVHSLHTDQEDYDETIGFLHLFQHANVFYLTPTDDTITHAAQNMMIATLAVVRAIGYQMGWDQNLITTLVSGVCSYELLEPHQREEARRTTREVLGLVDGSGA